MSPTAKMNALLSSFTVSIMFVIIRYFGSALESFSPQYPFLGPLAALVTSAGVYRLLALGLRWLMWESTWLKGIVLGPTFMHGTWIGWFSGHNGELRYMVEHYTQDLDSLKIAGHSFTETKKKHGQWFSETVALDVEKGKLMFSYSLDILTRPASVVGIHSSSLQRKSQTSAPEGLDGFAHDLNDFYRSPVSSTKVSPELIPIEKALEMAIAKFKILAP